MPLLVGLTSIYPASPVLGFFQIGHLITVSDSETPLLFDQVYALLWFVCTLFRSSNCRSSAFVNGEGLQQYTCVGFMCLKGLANSI